MERKSLLKNKRGTILEIIVVIVIITIMAITVPIARKVFVDVNETFSEKFGDEAESVMIKSHSAFDVIDGMFLFLIFSLGFGGIYLAYKLNFAPIFWVFAVMFLAAGIMVAAMMSNVQEKIITTDDMVETSSYFVGMNFAMSQLPLYILGIGIIIVTILFIKFRRGRE